jgi:Holliday junction resolvasome RuvABC DNA-binding subunit
MARFSLADGTPLGEPTSLRVGRPREHEPTPEEDAIAALKKLEFSPREAKKLVRAALEKPRSAPWTAEELLREALLLSG